MCCFCALGMQFRHFKVAAGVRKWESFLRFYSQYYYMDGLIKRLDHSNLGCRIDGVYFGSLLYADDIVLLATSLCDLQKILDICALLNL